MKKNSTEFRDRFQRWKNGEQVYENGRVIPHYEGGSDGTYYGNSRIEPVTGEAGNLGGITVYGKKPKYNYLKEWAGHTHPLTFSDLGKGIETATAGFFPNPILLADDVINERYGDAFHHALRDLTFAGGPVGKGAIMGLGASGLLSEDGVQKTVEKFGEGDIWGGTKSLVGDVLNAAMTVYGGKGLNDYANKIANRVINTQTQRAIHPPVTEVRSTDVPLLESNVVESFPEGLLNNESLIARGTNQNEYLSGLINEHFSKINSLLNQPYQIQRYPGFMLKPLMEGNPLERQLSKAGTISVNSIKAQAAKSNSMEKSVIDEVLASEQFAGQKSIDYNAFRKAIHDKLITYKVVPDSRYKDYGLNRLGFSAEEYNAYNDMLKTVKNINPELNDNQIRQLMFERFGPEPPQFQLNTFTFENPRIGAGNNSHYNTTTLGHSRTYTRSDKPDVLYVMESQSDWAQQSKKPTPRFTFNRSENGNTNIILDQSGEVQYVENGEGMPYSEFMNLGVPTEEMNFTKAKNSFYKNYPTEQVQYLHDNYTLRQIQENLKYAAEHGQTRMRYPTPETAAKIEGYAKNYKTSPRYEQLISRRMKILDLPEFKMPSPDPEMYMTMSPEQIEMFEADYNKLLDSPRYIKAKRIYDRLEDEIYEEAKHISPDYSPEHKTILKKYSDFPKQFKKLWKDQEVRTVTDEKGNSWYEVDVPKNFLKREWIYGIAPWIIGGGLTIPTITNDKR